MEKLDLVLRQKTITDVALVAYMTFLNEKGLLKEAKEYVAGFLSSIKKEEMAMLIERNRAVLEQVYKKYETDRSAKK